MKSELPMTLAKTVLWQCTHIDMIIPEASDVDCRQVSPKECNLSSQVKRLSEKKKCNVEMGN